jgi:hypothetical protein
MSFTKRIKSLKDSKMKRTIIFSVMLLALTSIITLQSCTKSSVAPDVANNVGMPSVPVPSTGTVIAFTAPNQAVNLSWATSATSGPKWTVYFGKSSTPSAVASNLTTTTYTAKIGTTGGIYYWQVSSVDANGLTQNSPVWNFVVHSAPATPVLTTPANNATLVNSTTAALVWTCTDPEGFALTYDVYFGTTATPPVLTSGVSASTYTPTMAYNTVYYWKIVAHDPYGGVSTSAVFTFKTDVQKPDYTVFNGSATEVAALNVNVTGTVTIQRLATTNMLSLYLPLADAMVTAGWGTVYTGAHAIIITYDPVTLIVTSTKQAWCDSFIDPIEMGPMSLQVSSGTIDPLIKKISIKWKISGNAYWGSDYTTGTCTYTMK